MSISDGDRTRIADLVCNLAYRRVGSVEQPVDVSVSEQVSDRVWERVHCGIWIPLWDVCETCGWMAACTAAAAADAADGGVG